MAYRKNNATRIAYLEEALSSPQSQTDECLIWPFSKTDVGYAQIRLPDGTWVGVHRLAFKIRYGRYPDANTLHRCDNRACFNPRHLFEGSHADNVRDKCSKGRQARGETDGFSRLTDEQVRQIRAEYVPRKNGLILAKKFGVSVTTISRVGLRKAWKHVQ